MKAAGFLLCSLLLSAGMGAVQAATYAIAGKVYQSVTKSPLPRTRVMLYDYGRTGTPRSAVTDGEGRFRFDGLSAGKYSLWARHNVYGAQLFGSKLLGASYGSAVAVGPDLDSEDLQFAMIPGGVITGVVLDADADPAPRVRLSAFRLTGKPGGVEPMTAVSTNDLGVYRFFGLPQGRYIIAAAGTPWYRTTSESHAGGAEEVPLTFPLTFHPSASTSEEAAAVEVFPGAESRADITLTAVRSGNLTINLPNFECAASMFAVLTVPVQSSEVAAQSYRPRVTPRPKSDSREASCSLWTANLAPGRYLLTISTSPTQVALRQTIDVAEGQNEIEVPVVRPATVAGSVEVNGGGNPGQFMVALQLAGSRRGGAVRVQPDGSFKFDGVSANQYKVVVFGKNELAITAMYGRGAKMAGGFIIIPETGSVELNLTVDSSTQDLTGRVVAGGKPAAGAFALLVPKEQVRRGVGFRMDQSDTDGTFRWTGVAPGDYFMLAFAEGTELDYNDPEELLKHPERAIPLSVRSGSNPPVELQLEM